MHLHPEWKKILRYAWSVRLIALAAFLTGLEAALPYLPAFLSIPEPAMAVVTSLVVMAAFIARLLPQKELKDAD